MSSALDLDGSSKGTVLNGPCDWKQWISIIKKFATSHSLWDFLDPAVKEGKPVLQQPVEPTFRQINHEASDLVDLTSEEFRRLEFLHTQYRSKLQGYRDQVKALASLQQHIVKTIGNYYSTIAEEHDVAKQLALLQARLPDVQDLRPTQDFLQAVSSINAPFTDYWVNKMEDEAVFGKPEWKTDFPDGIKISEIFERAHRIKAANNSKGSFGAAFQGKGEKSERKEDKPKWSSSKNADGVPMCVCGEYHRFVDCFYLIKSARPDGWTPDQKVEKKIKEILDSNPWAKKMTEKAQDFKKKEMEKSSDSSVKGTAFAEPKELFAGDSQLQILGYGTVRMKLEEGGLFQLNEVAFVPKFHTNIASSTAFLRRIQLESTIWTRL
ncbi:GAG-pre-integrase domain-containing protein [Hirsutella rhossiliensis]